MLFDCIQRIRHAKGFGVHSPFAFNFITNVIYSKHWYYAFIDIENVLLRNNIDFYSHKLHHLSYRLIQYFKPDNILEIGSSNDVNSLFISCGSSATPHDCIEKDYTKRTLINKLLTELGHEINFCDIIDTSKKYDSIFINIDTEIIEKELLFDISHKDAFWVVSGIKSKMSKQFWKSIVQDDRVSVSFDIKDIGIVLLDTTYKKRNYLV